MSACSADIKKFCYDQLNLAQRSPTEAEGVVLQCLKARFAQRVSVKQYHVGIVLITSELSSSENEMRMSMLTVMNRTSC